MCPERAGKQLPYTHVKRLIILFVYWISMLYHRIKYNKYNEIGKLLICILNDDLYWINIYPHFWKHFRKYRGTIWLKFAKTLHLYITVKDDISCIYLFIEILTFTVVKNVRNFAFDNWCCRSMYKMKVKVQNLQITRKKSFSKEI